MVGWKRKIAPLALGTIPALILVDSFAAAFGFVLPTAIHASVAAALVGVAFWGTLPYGRRAAGGVACSLALVTATLYFFPFGARKDFLRRVDRLSTGTARSAVLQIMGEDPGRDLSGIELPDRDTWYGDGDADCTVRYEADGRVGEISLSVEPFGMLYGGGYVGSE